MWQLTIYCHLKPPNLKSFCDPGHQRSNFDGFIYIHYAAPPYSATPTFMRQVVSAIYFLLFCKVWLSLVCWPLCAKPGNKVKCRIYGGWVKTPVQFYAVCGPKFMIFWAMYEIPSIVSNALSLLSTSCFVRKTQPVKFAAVVHKRWLLDPKFSTCIFKLHTLPNIWPVLVKFRSASSEDSWRNKKERKKESR